MTPVYVVVNDHHDSVRLKVGQKEVQHTTLFFFAGGLHYRHHV